MSTKEIKQSLIDKIDTLKGRQLQDVYGMVMNYVNENTVSWESLSKNEKAAINEGVRQLDAGKGIPHEKVMARIRKRYSK